jgi:glucoamylase
MMGPGGLIPEQVWDAGDIPARGLFQGRATGSAMPLIWAHAELIKLAMIRDARQPVEMLPAVIDRYAARPPAATGPWYWRDSLDPGGPVASPEIVPHGRDLIIEDSQPFALHWGHDGWRDVADVDAAPLGFDRYGASLTAAAVSSVASVQFTRRYASGWEGRDHDVPLGPSARASYPVKVGARA